MSAATLQAKLGYVDSEKSPALQMANTKVSLALARQVTFLERSERLVSSRILADQKVLFRRFQAKLAHSRLEDARRHGDKEQEQELLRARGLGAGLHTSVGLRAEAEGRELQAALRQAAARSCSTGRRQRGESNSNSRRVAPKSAPAGLGRMRRGSGEGSQVEEHDGSTGRGRRGSASSCGSSSDQDDSLTESPADRHVGAEKGDNVELNVRSGEKGGRAVSARRGGRAVGRRARPVTAFVTRMATTRGGDNDEKNLGISPPVATRRLRSAAGSLTRRRASCSHAERGQNEQLRVSEHNKKQGPGRALDDRRWLVVEDHHIERGRERPVSKYGKGGRGGSGREGGGRGGGTEGGTGGGGGGTSVAWIDCSADGRGKVSDETTGPPVTSTTNTGPPPSSPTTPIITQVVSTPAICIPPEAPAAAQLQDSHSTGTTTPTLHLTPDASTEELAYILPEEDENESPSPPESPHSPSSAELDPIDQVLYAQAQQADVNDDGAWRRPLRPETAPVSGVRFNSTTPAARGTPSIATGATSAGRKAKKAARPTSTKRPIRASIFQEETGPTLLDVHRLYVRRQGYDERVQRFCETIRPFRAPADTVTDYYYSLRLAETKPAARGGDKKHHSRVSDFTENTDGTTEEVTGKGKGVRMRSLTFKNVTL